METSDKFFWKVYNLEKELDKIKHRKENKRLRDFIDNYQAYNDACVQGNLEQLKIILNPLEINEAPIIRNYWFADDSYILSRCRKIYSYKGFIICFELGHFECVRYLDKVFSFPLSIWDDALRNYKYDIKTETKQLFSKKSI